LKNRRESEMSKKSELEQKVREHILSGGDAVLSDPDDGKLHLENTSGEEVAEVKYDRWHALDADTYDVQIGGVVVRCSGISGERAEIVPLAEACPWACCIIPVDGGFRAFKSRQDAETWVNQDGAGELMDYETGDAIRNATPAERLNSIEAAAMDGGAGVIVVDGRRCYVV
jgi:hypothetical protein